MPSDAIKLDGEFVASHDKAWTVGEHLGYPLRILHSSELGYLFEHVCDRAKGTPPTVGEIFIRCAPRIDLHDVAFTDDKISVSPSILCLGCNLHGFVIDGVWRSA